MPPNDCQLFQALPSQVRLGERALCVRGEDMMLRPFATAYGAAENVPPSDCHSPPIVYQIAESIPSAKTASVSFAATTACGVEKQGCGRARSYSRNEPCDQTRGFQSA